MLNNMAVDIDAVIVSTPDHTHAPVSIMAMEMNKPVYCQKPLTHFVSEARSMRKLAEEKNLITQMGIQVHSFYEYKLATILIQSGILGKVHTVRAWLAAPAAPMPMRTRAGRGRRRAATIARSTVYLLGTLGWCSIYYCNQGGYEASYRSCATIHDS